MFHCTIWRADWRASCRHDNYRHRRAKRYRQRHDEPPNPTGDCHARGRRPKASRRRLSGVDVPPVEGGSIIILDSLPLPRPLQTA